MLTVVTLCRLNSVCYNLPFSFYPAVNVSRGSCTAQVFVNRCSDFVSSCILTHDKNKDMDSESRTRAPGSA